MLPSSTRFKPSVPLPVMPLTVTRYTEPLTGVTCVSVAPTVPVSASWKSVGSTPVTLSLKVTVNCTLVALVRADGVVRLMDTTCG